MQLHWPFERILPDDPYTALVLVPGGPFWMGSADEDKDGFDWEKPRHQVQVPSFAIGKYPVTQAFWQRVMGSKPSFFEGDLRPVEQVSWYESCLFCNTLGQMTGQEPLYYRDRSLKNALAAADLANGNTEVFQKKDTPGFRLPSEAEWEYAARGGQNTKGYRYAGGDNLDAVGWYDDNSHQESKPVGWKLPNELGLFDMSGNVYEWCEDQWHDKYDKPPLDGTAWVDREQGTYRVFRGGHWGNSPRYCRPAYRSHGPPAYRLNGVGLRVVLVVPPV
jgi:formylglycine-generating enzyme required for sulfatase activity